MANPKIWRFFWVWLYLGVNDLLQPIQLLCCHVPILHQHLTSKLAPESTNAAITVRTERTVLIQIVRGTRVISTLKLELGILIQSLNLLRTNLQKINSISKPGKTLYTLHINIFRCTILYVKMVTRTQIQTILLKSTSCETKWHVRLWYWRTRQTTDFWETESNSWTSNRSNMSPILL